MFFPSSIKNMRACIRCRIIMSKDQFIQLGCPTCRNDLRMQEDEGRVLACTTTDFQGYISMLKPGSFVSRFTGLERRRPGLYALTVNSQIPENILNESDYENDTPARATPDHRTPTTSNASTPRASASRSIRDGGSRDGRSVRQANSLTSRTPSVDGDSSGSETKQGTTTPTTPPSPTDSDDDPESSSTKRRKTGGRTRF